MQKGHKLWQLADMLKIDTNLHSIFQWERRGGGGGTHPAPTLAKTEENKSFPTGYDGGSR